MNETELTITKKLVTAAFVALFLILVFFILPAYLGTEDQQERPAPAPMEPQPGAPPPPGAPPR